MHKPVKYTLDHMLAEADISQFLAALAAGVARDVGIEKTQVFNGDEERFIKSPISDALLRLAERRLKHLMLARLIDVEYSDTDLTTFAYLLYPFFSRYLKRNDLEYSEENMDAVIPALASHLDDEFCKRSGYDKTFMVCLDLDELAAEGLTGDDEEIVEVEDKMLNELVQQLT